MPLNRDVDALKDRNWRLIFRLWGTWEAVTDRPPAGHERGRVGTRRLAYPEHPSLPSQKIEWYDADEYKRSLSGR